MKYDLFNKFIDYLHGYGKQPDLSVENNEDEQELADTIEMSKKLGNSALEPDARFSKQLLNEMKMELREQTARRVKFPVWKINFKLGWMGYASAVIVAVIFVVWGFGQLDNINHTAPVQPIELQVPDPLLTEKPDKSNQNVADKSATEVILPDRTSTFAQTNPVPEIVEETEDDTIDMPAETTTQPVTSGVLVLGDMPEWSDSLEEELNDLDNLINDLESFGAGLNSLDTDLDNF